MFLENAKRIALQDLKQLGPQQVVGSRHSAFQVGIGYAVAKGWATYESNGVFKITSAGLDALSAIHNPH